MNHIKTCDILTQNKPESNKREEIFALIVATISRTKVMLKLALVSALSRVSPIALWLIIAAVYGIAALGAVSRIAHAFDNGQYENLDPKIRDWFRSVRSPKGVPCCDIADGHRTTWRGTSEGGYEVPIADEWRKVPPEAVVLNAGNPVGEAIVWYVKQGENTYHIRCFVPGGGV